MAMNWPKVTQVLDNMYSNKELAEKIGNQNAHGDYILIKETSMAVGEEAKDVFDKELEEEKYKLGNYKLIQKIQIWLFGNRLALIMMTSRLQEASVCFFKDVKIWRGYSCK